MFELGCWFVMAVLVFLTGPWRGVESLNSLLVSPLLILVIYWLRRIANKLPGEKL